MDEWRLLKDVAAGRRPPELIAQPYPLLRLKGGQKVTDFVNTYDAPNVVSGRFVEVVSAHELTGCRSIPALVRDNKGQVFPDYHILVIEGKAMRRTWTEGDVVDRADDAAGPQVTVEGLPFDIGTWDGSDFFHIYSEHGCYVSERAHDALAAAALFNLGFRDANTERRSFGLSEWKANNRDGWVKYIDGLA